MDSYLTSLVLKLCDINVNKAGNDSIYDVLDKIIDLFKNGYRITSADNGVKGYLNILIQIFMEKYDDVVISAQLLETYILISSFLPIDVKIATQFVKAGLLCLERSPNEKVLTLVGHIMDITKYGVTNEIDLLLLTKCIITCESISPDTIKSIADHFPVRRCQPDVIRLVTNRLDSASVLYFLDRILSHSEDHNHFISFINKKAVSDMIDKMCIETQNNVLLNPFDKMHLRVRILNKLIQLNPSLFPGTTTLLVQGMQYIHSISLQLVGHRFFELPQNECVLDWLVLLNAFLVGQAQRLALQCASSVIQYLHDITKFLLVLIPSIQYQILVLLLWLLQTVPTISPNLYQKYFYILIPSLSTFYSAFSVTLAISTNPQQIRQCFHSILDRLLQHTSFSQSIISSSLYDQLDDKQKKRLPKPMGSKTGKNKSKKADPGHSSPSQTDVSQISKWSDEADELFERLNYELASEVCREISLNNITTLQQSLLTTKISLHIHHMLVNEVFSDEMIAVECSPADNQVTLCIKVCSQLLKNPKYSFLPHESDWANNTTLLLRHLEFRLKSTLFHIDYSLYASLRSMDCFKAREAIEMDVIVHQGQFSPKPPLPTPSEENESFSQTISTLISSIQHLLSLRSNHVGKINHPLNRFVDKLLRSDEVVIGNLFPALLKSVMKTVPQLFTIETLMNCIKCIGFDAFTAFRFLASEKNIDVDWEFHQPPLQRISVHRELILFDGMNALSHCSPFLDCQFKFCDENGVGMGPTREFISLFANELQNREYHYWNDGSDIPCCRVSSPCFPSPSLPSNVGIVICRCGEWLFQQCPTHHSLLCFNPAGKWVCSEKDFSVSLSDIVCPKCNNPLDFCLQLPLVMEQKQFEKITEWASVHPQFEECRGHIKWDPITGECCQLEVESPISLSDEHSWNFRMNIHSLLQLHDCRVSNPISFTREYQYMTDELFPAPFHVVQDRDTYRKILFSIGVLLGYCLKNEIPAELPFHSFFIQCLKSGCTKVSDLDDAKNRLKLCDHNSLLNLFSYVNQPEIIASLELDSSIPGYSYYSVLPVKEVTAENYSEWLLKACDELVGSGVKECVESIQEGLNYMMDASLLQMLPISAIETLFFGDSIPWLEEDFEYLFEFSPVMKDSHLAKWFKGIVLGMTSLQQDQLIMFVTGQRRFFSRNLPISVEISGDEDALPTAMTCVNLLRLPPYKSESIMRSKLIQAIELGHEHILDR